MKPLRSALASWQPGAAVDADPLLQIKAAWRDAVGEDVASNSRPLEIAGEALLVVTRSSAWSQQLAFLSDRILDGLHERTGIRPARLRFRVGRVNESRARPAGPAPRPRTRKLPESREPAPTLEDAVERFRADVLSLQRAKTAAGWKECVRCGVRILPSSGPFCVPCENAHAQERDATVARLLYEAPWLGYTGIAALVEGLTHREYESIRLRLLRRWHDSLERVRRTGGKHLTTRDRMIASSYVLLKSELDPERIAPAVVRDLLGDELHDIFYGSENS